MKKIGIIANVDKDSKLEITSSIIKWLEGRNCRPYLESNIADLLGRADLKSHDGSLYKETEFIITLGGDGTLLGAAKYIGQNQTPILGINMGRLGFLTDADTQNMFATLEKVLSGDFTIENRMMLETVIIRGNDTTGPFYSLNDTYITGGMQSRSVALDVSIGENLMNTYTGDGIIVSTPTGSTAYSLSAGGPIISPSLNAILITPLCAHSLNARSIVVSENDIVNITIRDRYRNAYFNSDGQSGYALKGGDMVTIRKAPFYTKLIRTSGISFFELLRLKLNER